MRWLPLIGTLLFLAIGIGWRGWLQSRRYGSSGILLFQSGRWQQNLRDSLGLLLVVCLVGQALLAAREPSRSFDGLTAIGVMFLFGGIAFLVAAQLQLGSSWRVGIDEGAAPGLVTTGLYRWCRNPIYLAMLSVLTGYTALVPTRLSVGLLVGTFIVIRVQVLAEEAYLLRTYGARYREYASRAGRFLPGIGRIR